MKKLIVVLLSIVMVFGLAACGGNGGESSGGSNWHEDAKAEEVFWCSYNYLYGNGYVCIDNYVESLKNTVPDNKFTSLVTEAYALIDTDNLSDVEMDFFNCLFLMADFYDMTKETNLGKVWCVGYENDEAVEDDRDILVEVSGTYEENQEETGTQYCLFQTVEWSNGWGFWMPTDYTAETAKKHMNLDVSKDSGKTRYWMGDDRYKEGPSYYLVKSSKLNDLYSQSKELLMLLSEYHRDIYNDMYNQTNLDAPVVVWSPDDNKNSDSDNSNSNSYNNGYETEDMSGNSDIDTNTCKSCGRKYNAGDSGGNYMNIARTGMCKSCYSDYKSMSNFLDN